MIDYYLCFKKISLFGELFLLLNRLNFFFKPEFFHFLKVGSLLVLRCRFDISLPNQAANFLVFLVHSQFLYLHQQSFMVVTKG